VAPWTTTISHRNTRYSSVSNLEIFEAEQEDYEYPRPEETGHPRPSQIYAVTVQSRRHAIEEPYYPLKPNGIYQAAQNMASKIFE
jgi:hypothetical protein